MTKNKGGSIMCKFCNYSEGNVADEDIINKIYQERSNVGKYFRKSSIEIQNNLKNVRFPNENAKALKLLKCYSY